MAVMSWDFSMVAKLRADGGFVGLSGCDANYTYNVSPMYYSAFGGDGIRTLNEMKGIDAAPLISAAIRKMIANAMEYRAMEPANGWGSYDGALELLYQLQSWCIEFPEAYVRVS